MVGALLPLLMLVSPGAISPVAGPFVVLGVAGEVPPAVVPAWTQQVALGLARGGLRSASGDAVSTLGESERTELTACVARRRCGPEQLARAAFAEALVVLVFETVSGAPQFQLVAVSPRNGQVVEGTPFLQSLAVVVNVLADRAQAFARPLTTALGTPLNAPPPWPAIRLATAAAAGVTFVGGTSLLIGSALDASAIPTAATGADAMSLASAGRVKFGVGVGLSVAAVALGAAALYAHGRWSQLQPERPLRITSIGITPQSLTVAGTW